MQESFQQSYIGTRDGLMVSKYVITPLQVFDISIGSGLRRMSAHADLMHYLHAACHFKGTSHTCGAAFQFGLQYLSTKPFHALYIFQLRLRKGCGR